MRRRWLLVTGSLVVAGFGACSSASAPVDAPDPDAGGSARSDGSASAGDDGSPDASRDDAPGDDATVTPRDASPSVVDAAADSHPGPADVDASAACVAYCKCMARNCADKIFPSGCLPECGAQTNWDLECRTGMCMLVPDEPNNDHCTHAFGVDECLNH